MHILHFMNIPFLPDQLKSNGSGINGSGGWMAAMIGQMLENTKCRFTCVSIGNTRRRIGCKEDRLECIILPKNSGLSSCAEMVRRCSPDLIHIHGTERKYGLLAARRMVKCPVIISVQGLLGPASRWYHYFGNRSVADIARMHRWLEIPAVRGQMVMFLQTRHKAKREKEIITGNRFFIGRTEWDRANIRTINPSAQYHHCDELLRDAFWQRQWHIKQAERHRVIFTNAGHPRKGTELLLEAVRILKPRYPNIHIRIIGGISRRSGYGRYLRRRIHKENGAAVELGPLTAEEMTREMRSAHLFISPSYMDNSPNALCEAQLLGMPVISTYTGGVPTLIEEKRTGLFFPTGDAPMLAGRIEQLFEDDALATRMGRQAHQHAARRHAPGTIVRRLAEIYENVLRQ